MRLISSGPATASTTMLSMPTAACTPRPVRERLAPRHGNLKLENAGTRKSFLPPLVDIFLQSEEKSTKSKKEKSYQEQEIMLRQSGFGRT